MRRGGGYATLMDMSFAKDLFRPVSLGIAVIGTALSSLAVIGIGVASIAARFATFGIGIGIMLIVYGVLVGLGAWLGLKRIALARGLMVAPALLHLASAISLVGGGDTPQRIGAGIAAACFAVIVVAALLPGTRLALSSVDQHPDPGQQ